MFKVTVHMWRRLKMGVLWLQCCSRSSRSCNHSARTRACWRSNRADSETIQGNYSRGILSQNWKRRNSQVYIEPRVACRTVYYFSEIHYIPNVQVVGPSQSASASPPLLLLVLWQPVVVLWEPGSLWLIPPASMTDRQPCTALPSLLACSLHPMVPRTPRDWMELRRMNLVNLKEAALLKSGFSGFLCLTMHLDSCLWAVGTFYLAHLTVDPQ